jgi:hypothetical protein
MTLEEIVNNLKSAGQDYGQLFNNNPRMDSFASVLQKGVGQLIPSNADFKSPEAMRDWGTAAALNAPMGLTFIGKNAANWNPVKAAEAEKLLNAGIDPAEVWKSHLIGRMPDKSLFSEIDDSRAFLKGSGNYNDLVMNRYNAFENTGRDMINNSLNVSDIYKHYPLSEEYSDLMKLNAEFIPKSKNTLGSFTGNAIQIRSDLPRKSAEYVIPHELQHAIQDREGWAMGGNSEQMKEEALAMLRRDVASGEIPSTEQAMAMLPMAQQNAYRRLTGEAQARATQDRINMNMQQRRDTYPLAGGKLSDIPLDQLINRYR